MGAKVHCDEMISSIDSLIGNKMYLPVAPKRGKDEKPDPSVVDNPYDKVRGYWITRTERSLQLRKVQYKREGDKVKATPVVSLDGVTSITFYKSTPGSEWEFLGTNSAFPQSFYDEFKKAAGIE